MTNDQKKIIGHVITLLKQKYSDGPQGHDWFHFERVWKLAKRLAKGENVNQFVLQMAALLHDVDDYKFKKAGDDELSDTRKLLDIVGVKGKDREQIFSIVKNVSFKGADVKATRFSLEGDIVQDADRLEGLGAIGIARVFSYNGYAGHQLYNPSIKPVMHKDFESYKKNKSTAINHFYEKLLLIKDRLNTPQAKKIAVHRHKFLELFLQEFFGEIRGKL